MEEKETRTVRVAVIEPGCEPRRVAVPAGEGHLGALQRLVGGRIEAVDVLWGGDPFLWVNDEGLFDPGCPPNRAIYADALMSLSGYVPQLGDGLLAVEPGEVYTILFGTVVAACEDADGEPEDMDDESFGMVLERFGGPASIMSGPLERARIVSDRFTEEILALAPLTAEGESLGVGAQLRVRALPGTAGLVSGGADDGGSAVRCGVLACDPVDWPALTAGDPVPFELRGDRPPMIPFSWLASESEARRLRRREAELYVSM